MIIRAYVKMIRNTLDNQSDIISLLFGIYGISYLGSVIFAMTFFDASTKFRLRILAPLMYVLFPVYGALWLISTKKQIPEC
jgi:hypothetical protein